MTLEGTCGHKTISSLDDLLATLRDCRTGDFGEFWISHGKFPALTIHTHGDLAYLHFFPAEKHPGFQAVGDASSRDEVVFKQAGQGDFSMPRAVVVDIAQAYQAAAEFFTSLQLPGCIRWTEL